jgi:hypothetical protein
MQGMSPLVERAGADEWQRSRIPIVVWLSCEIVIGSDGGTMMLNMIAKSTMIACNLIDPL